MSLCMDLLRHGETEQGGGLRGSIDDALTTRGWGQMRDAVLAKGPWDRIVTSPLQRCARYAEALQQALELPLAYEPELRELHFGEWEGRSAAQLMETHERELGLFWSDPYGFTPPAGEPVASFRERVLGAVERLYRDYAGQRLLLITHGGVMRLLLAQARGLPQASLLQVEVRHGALVTLQVESDGSLREPG